MSLMTLVVGVISCILFRNKKTDDHGSENSIKKEEKVSLKNMFDFSIMKNWRFILWCVAYNLIEGANNVPYFFLPCRIVLNLDLISIFNELLSIAYATHSGLTSSQGALALSIGSGMNALGRMITG